LRSAVKAVVPAAAIEASAAKKIIVIKRYRCFIDPRGLRTNLLGPFLFELCIKQLSGPIVGPLGLLDHRHITTNRPRWLRALRLQPANRKDGSHVR